MRSNKQSMRKYVKLQREKIKRAVIDSVQEATKINNVSSANRNVEISYI